MAEHWTNEVAIKTNGWTNVRKRKWKFVLFSY